MKYLWLLWVLFFSACSVLPAKQPEQFSAAAGICLLSDDTLEKEEEFFHRHLQQAGIVLKDDASSAVLLKLDPSLDDDVFQISVPAADTALIQAGSAAAAQNGCVYFWKALTAGSGLDVGSSLVQRPSTAQRSVLLDCGRKYYRPEEIKSLLDTMADQCMNALLLHFWENSGIRLESGVYDWIAGSSISLSRFSDQTDPDENRILSRQEMQELIQYAASLHIEIIPSMDSPGHNTWLLQQCQKNLQKNYSVQFNKNGQSGQMDLSVFDLSNAEGRSFLEEVVLDYAAFFAENGCRSIDLGGDELFDSSRTYIGSASFVKWQALDSWQNAAQSLTGNTGAVPYDLFISYMNVMKEKVCTLGFTQVSMWNDELYRKHDTAWRQVVVPDPAIVVQWWNADGGIFVNQPSVYAEQGHPLINCTNFYNYYILDPKLRYLGVHCDAIFREYSPFVFLTSRPESSSVHGSCFCIWSDNPVYESGSEVLENTKKLLFFMGAKDFDPVLSKKCSFQTMLQLYEALAEQDR